MTVRMIINYIKRNTDMKSQSFNLKKTTFLIILFFIIPLSIYGKDYYLKGFAASKSTKIHIPYTDVVLLNPDSSVVAATKTIDGRNNDDIQAYFTLKVPKSGKYIIRCSHVSYETTYKNIDLKFGGRFTFLYAGGVFMETKIRELDEVAITATSIRMVLKNDTIIYNAESFKLAEGSMLEALVRQLPGAELKDDGRIMVNGRFIQTLLLNGRDFFAGDPKIALDNLPSYMIDKVKVYERESEANRLKGIKMHGSPLVMDVNLKKQYSIGWIANAEVGVGTTDRYMGKFFGLRFSPNSRLSIFGNVNNLNDNRTPGRNGDWSPAQMPDGLLSSTVGGVEFEHFGVNDSHSISTSNKIEHSDADNEVTSSVVNFFPGGDTYSQSFAASRNKSTKFTTENGFRFRPDGNFVSIDLDLDYLKYTRNSTDLLGNFSENPSSYLDENLLDSLFSPNVEAALREITTTRRWKKRKGEGNELNTKFAFRSFFYPNKQTKDNLVLEGAVTYSSASHESFNRYLIDYPSDEQQAADFRNQYYNTPTERLNYNLKAEYNLRFGEYSFINSYYKYNYTYQSVDNSLYRLDKLSNWGENTQYPLGALPSTTDSLQIAIDNQNSYYSKRYDSDHTMGLFFYYHKYLDNNGMMTLKLDLPTSIETDQLDYHRNSKFYPLKRKDVFLEPDVYVRWATNKGRDYYYLKYKLSSTAPNMTYLLDIRDDSDPLYISLGNSDLKNSHKHSFELTTDAYRAEKEQTFSAGLTYWFEQNAVAIGSIYNRETGVRTTMPNNVDGNSGGSAYVNFGRALGEKRRWNYSTATAYHHYQSVDLIGVEGGEGTQLSEVNNSYFLESLRLNYRMDKFQLGLKANGYLTHATSKRQDFSTINGFDFNYGVNALVDLPWQMQLSTDLGIYSRRGYENSAINTNELVWNARLSKKCMNGNLTFMLDGFDILGNLSNVRRYVNGQGLTESYYNVVPSYALFHVVYRLNKQPKKKNVY